MSKLFVIGNGFDIAHGMLTSYEEFHKYLKRKYPNAVEPNGLLPEWKQNPDGDIYYSTDEEVGFIESIISEVEGVRWSDLENTLGYLEYDEYLDDWTDDESDNPYDEVYRNQDLASTIYDLISTIPDYFNEWIDTININRVVPKKAFCDLINCGKDQFLTFNYTRTLEVVYGCQKVCHIHGVQGTQLLFGHGNNIDHYEDDMAKHIGSEDALGELHRKLMKDTIGAIKKNRAFFNNLSGNIDEIYSYGFSFADVDLIYIKEICKNLKTDAITWYLNDYNCSLHSKEYCRLEKILRECGFKGKVLTFHIN